jgi:hypothetical protein
MESVKEQLKTLAVRHRSEDRKRALELWADANAEAKAFLKSAKAVVRTRRQGRMVVYGLLTKIAAEMSEEQVGQFIDVSKRAPGEYNLGEKCARTALGLAQVKKKYEYDYDQAITHMSRRYGGNGNDDAISRGILVERKP